MKRTVRALAVALGLSLLMVAAVFAWEDRLLGQPSDYAPGHSYGLFVWNDDAGLHLRTATDDNSPHYFNGTIHTDGTIVNLHVTTDGNDSVCICPNGHTITYNFHTWLASDGVDYGISGGTYQTVTAYHDSGLMETQNIHLGAGGVNPENNPFTDIRNP